MFFDQLLWGKLDGYILECMTVIGPYPTSNFFREILNNEKLIPRTIILVVDRTWPSEKLIEIKKVLRGFLWSQQGDITELNNLASWRFQHSPAMTQCDKFQS
ncbi:MAG: hypothetical protein QG599_519 [Pseudomonadota bacterium]|nr:hypothetical protein [Pseudomonadota bacterium]